MIQFFFLLQVLYHLFYKKLVNEKRETARLEVRNDFTELQLLALLTDRKETAGRTTDPVWDGSGTRFIFLGVCYRLALLLGKPQALDIGLHSLNVQQSWMNMLALNSKIFLGFSTNIRILVDTSPSQLTWRKTREFILLHTWRHMVVCQRDCFTCCASSCLSVYQYFFGTLVTPPSVSHTRQFIIFHLTCYSGLIIPATRHQNMSQSGLSDR